FDPEPLQPVGRRTTVFERIILRRERRTLRLLCSPQLLFAVQGREKNLPANVRRAAFADDFVSHPVSLIELRPGVHPGVCAEVFVASLEPAKRAIFDRRSVGARQESLQDRNACLAGVNRGHRADDRQRDAGGDGSGCWGQRAISLLESPTRWPLTVS